MFSDGHGIAKITRWFDDLGSLGGVDWGVVGRRYWVDTVQDMDRQRRKQAEFLAHRFVPWQLIHEIAVIDEKHKGQVKRILSKFPAKLHKVVYVRRDWYYW